jgi:hypothetical protein
LIVLTLGASFGLAPAVASVAPSLRIPGPYRAVGLIVMWLGLVIPIWAIAVLGKHAPSASSPAFGDLDARRRRQERPLE